MSKNKTLVLIRHAKSDWEQPELTDHERPLNARGERDAPRMAAWLKKQVPQPDLLISSTAKRARQTAHYFTEVLLPHSAQTTQKLYDASVDDILSVIKSIPKHINCAIIVGHNPGFTYTAEHLTQELIYNMPTCSVVIMQLIVDEWSDVGRGTAKLKTFMKPKELATEA